jgi:transcription-repair coupling factor (superfamily II helicase)
MNISSLIERLRRLPEYQQLRRTIISGEEMHGPLLLPRAARAATAAALVRDLNRSAVLVVPHNDRLLTLAEELPAWDPELKLIPFPEPNPIFYEHTAWWPRTIQQRAAALAIMTADQPQNEGNSPAANHPALILASTKAVMTRTIAMQDFLNSTVLLRTGSERRLDRLLDLLLGIGYAPASLVTERGQFSRRGGILDLWPPADPQPVRIEFFGDQIESMRRFEASSQRSTESTDQVRIAPAREGLPHLFQQEWSEWLPSDHDHEDLSGQRLLEFALPWMNPSPTGFLDFLPSETLVLVDDAVALEDAVSEQEEQALASRADQIQAGQLPSDFPIPYLTLSDLQDSLREHRAINLGHSGDPGMATDLVLGEKYSPGPRFGGQLRPLFDHLSRQRQAHNTVIVVSRQAPRLSALWSQEGDEIPVIRTLPAELGPGDVYFVHGALSDGWILGQTDGPGTHLLTDAEIFGWARPRPRRRPRVHARAPEATYADFRHGGLLVHLDYGIGRFAGLVERTLDDLRREYLLVEYANGDQLYVPIHQADRLSSYVGADAATPKISRLGTQAWEHTKRKAREAVEEVARDLLQLYANRMTVSGYAFSVDSPWQQELEASFPYMETDDQLRAIQAVKLDMERSRPMDRLICGDVGYGKTEVALRAAFKAIMDGKQVAMLVPTTVLAQQHYNTFIQRLAPFPAEVEMLSRFRSRSEAGSILQRLTKGEIDIVVGTHRLLQQDVHFKDLGLLIIDEEQRFGVTHKEFLKQMRTEVDVLTMTATPIPRTLYMSLTGVRDISTINTPPEERLPVKTFVGQYNPRLIRQAILREIHRRGQVFFVHNRVLTIDAMQRRLIDLVPEARIAIAHGQMPERKLESVMNQFTQGEIDVLLCTSIIESGLDIPNANTLIVDKADGFGLAQLYQLRGRVGRGSARAYAYFFRHPHKRSTPEALERLEIISEHDQLGAGYSIAMRDLEMRGAGDILGNRQHGHISAIGFHLYTRLLGEAVRRLRAQSGIDIQPHEDIHAQAMPPAISIDLPIPSAIPSEYVNDRNLRLQLYRRMAQLNSQLAITNLSLELEDRFGPFPSEVKNLLYQLKVKVLASQAGVDSVALQKDQILLQMGEELMDLDITALGDDVRKSKRGIWLRASEPNQWPEKLLEVLGKLHEIVGDRVAA